jgi:hypothetical protein
LKETPETIAQGAKNSWFAVASEGRGQYHVDGSDLVLDAEWKEV